MNTVSLTGSYPSDPSSNFKLPGVVLETRSKKFLDARASMYCRHVHTDTVYHVLLHVFKKFTNCLLFYFLPYGE